jgi:arsenite-transporting ATPase
VGGLATWTVSQSEGFVTARAAARVLPAPAGRRCVLYAGKGGVGKTTAACATAIWAADAGLRTLLVTTDPAAHIGAVLGRAVGVEPVPVPGVEHLAAVEVDARAATAAYKDAVLVDARTRFDAATVARIAEELDSPCTEEVAVFQRFLDHLLSREFEVTVFDTAPTGHTLRLLELPYDYAQQLAVKAPASEESAAVDVLQRSRMDAALALLRDAGRTTVAFVLYPEATPVAEAARAARELAGLGIRTPLVVANQVLPAAACTHVLFRRRREIQLVHLAELPRAFPEALILTVALRAEDVRGVGALREVGREMFGLPSRPR